MPSNPPHVRLLVLLLFFIPLSLEAQTDVRPPSTGSSTLSNERPSSPAGELAPLQPQAVPSGNTVPGRFRPEGKTAEEPREIHYTHRLLQSDHGRQALRWLGKRKRQTQPAIQAPRRQDLVGDRRLFFVRNPEESRDNEPVFEEVEFELRRSGGNVELWVEAEELSPGRIGEAILDEIMNGLINETPANSIDPQRGVIEIARDIFGEQPNVDGSGILKILITDIRDGYNPPEQQVYIAGFFDPVNLLPRQVFEQSNEADILYINSNPGIYREGFPGQETRLNTMIHEFQHLIQANYAMQYIETGGGISLFQNEGQSELAEILAGFESRAMNFLNSRSELSGNVEDPERWVYRFRQNQGDVVLFDYQRAQLLHSYLAERVGPAAAGSLTRSSEFNDAAYQEALATADIELPDFFSDFYISSYASNRVEAAERFGFSRPQFSGLQVANPGEIYNFSMQPWIRGRQEQIGYGGALYTQWFGVDELRLEILETEGVRQDLLWRRPGEADYQYMRAGPGVFVLEEGTYEEIVLVSTNVTPNGDSSSPTDNRTFTYNGDWTPTGLIAQELAYHEEPAVQSPLPWDNSIFTYAVRVSPEFDAGVRNVAFTINFRENAVQGEGELQLALREANPSPDGAGYIPGELIASQAFFPNDVGIGENFIGVNSDQWQVQGGTEYFISIEVVEDRGGLYLEFLFDNGTSDLSEPDDNYVPARTLYGMRNNGEIVWGSLGYEDDEATPSQGRYNLNLLLSARLVGRPGLEIPDFPEPPVSESFELIKNYPNPFRGQTMIEFNVPEPAALRITLHDILGRQVRELFNGTAATGLHTLRLNAAELSSGVYFYRMISPGGVQSKKMTLIR